MAHKPHALIAIGDLHAASAVGLMPPTFTTDGGNVIHYNPLQAWLWACWLDFWKVVREYEIDAVIVNGDVPNGINAVDAETITVNESDQIECALAALEPLLKLRDRMGFPIYATRGTGFHSGRAGAREETIWREAGAEPNAFGRYTRWHLLMNWQERTVFATHHTSNAKDYPLNPLFKQLRDNAAAAALGQCRLVHIDIRSHVHRCHSVEVGGRHAATTPPWQAPTEFIHKVAPGAVAQAGGLIFWLDDRNTVQLRKCIYSPPPPVLTILPPKASKRSSVNSGTRGRPISRVTASTKSASA